jgi:autotransporter-associated beta strand protein
VTINAAIAGATSPVLVKSGRTITLGGGATSLGSLSGLGTLNLTSSTTKSYTFAENLNYNMGSFSAPTTTGLQVGNNSTVSVGGTGSVQGIGNNANGVVRVNGTNATLTMGSGSADAVIGRGTGLGILQIDNGSVSVLRNLQVGQTLTNSAARGSLIVNGGNLSLSGFLNINPSTSAAAITSQSVVEIAGGQVSASRIRLNNTSSSGHAQLTMTGGTLYLSNNGDAISTEGTGTSTSTITLSGGVIGSSTTTAGGGWTSAASMILGTTNGDITFQSANATSSSRNITLSGQLSGSGGLIKTGAGNLTLSGINTYAGVTTINAGTLQIGHASALGTSGNITFGGGTLQYGNGITTDLSSRLKNSASAIIVDTVANNVTFASVIDSSNSGGFKKTGTGNLTLNAANTFTGATSVDNGILVLGNGLALQNSAFDTTASVVGNSTVGLRNTGNSLTLGGLTGNKDLPSIFTTASGGHSNITTLTLNIGASQSHSYSGNITNGAPSMTLTKSGSGTQVLSGNNSYSGGTTLSSGTLVIGHASALGNGTLTQSSGASLLRIDTTGTVANAMSVYNVSAHQSATLNGSITVNNATFDVDSADTLTLSGAVSGSGGVTKNGTGTLVLSGSNTYAAATTVNSGTLTAAAAGATGNSTVINVTGGSFLVTAANAVSDSTNIDLDGGRMAMSGNFNENVGLLTLSKDSIIDFAGFVGTLRFSGVDSWAPSANLAIWNWSGTPRYGDPVNNYQTPSNLVFTNNATLTNNLANISFYSDSGTTFIGSGFEQGFTGLGGGTEIIAVPETETYFYALALLAGLVVQYLRRRAKRKVCRLRLTSDPRLNRSATTVAVTITADAHPLA